MNRTKKATLPSHLVLVSLLSTSLTVTVSITYMVLSILALIYRYECSTGSDEISGSSYFINVVYRTYIQNNDCLNTITLENLTQADSVFILTIITLCASAICLLAAIALLAIIKGEEQEKLHVFAYVYVGICCASLVVDLTFGIHFGMDYRYLTDQLDQSSPGLGMNYVWDAIRLGSLLLMTVCLKGFVIHAVNFVLFTLIIVYIVEYQKQLQKEQHPIHKMGALNAYDQTRRPDPWNTEPQMMYRGPQVNPTYVDDMSLPPRSPRRELSAPDYTRSESWQIGSRPFSYLDENKRAATTPTRAPSEPQWRRERDWPPPPVPAPDYSPHTPRRLKSALKPTYM